MVNPLFNRPRPNDGESAGCFFPFVQEENVILNMKQMFSIAGINFPNENDLNLLVPTYYPALSKILFLGPAGIYRLTIHRFSSHILPESHLKRYKGLSYFDFNGSRSYYRYKTDEKRVCQRCIEELGYEKIEWNLCYIPGCPDHAQLLTPVGQGANYQAYQLDEEEKSGIELFHYFLGMKTSEIIWANIPVAESLMALKGDQFFRLVDLLTWILYPQLSRSNFFTANKNDLQKIASSIRSIYCVFASWPTSFNEALETFVEKRMETDHYAFVMDYLGRVHEEILELYLQNTKGLYFVKWAFQRFVEDRYAPDRSLHNKVCEQDETEAVKTKLTATSNLLGISYDECSEIFKLCCSMTQDPFAEQEDKVILWKVVNTVTYDIASKGYITMSQYCGKYGIEEKYVEQLFRDEVLKCDRWFKNYESGTALIWRGAGLLGMRRPSYCNTRSAFIPEVDCARKKGDLIGYRLALFLLNGDISLLLSAVSEKRITVYRDTDGEKIENYKFYRNEVAALAKQLKKVVFDPELKRNVCLIPFPDTEDIGFWSDDLLQHWISKGYISLLRRWLVGHFGTYFDLISTREFQNQLFEIKDASTILGFDETAVLGLVHANNLETDYFPPINGQETQYVNLSDLLALLNDQVINIDRVCKLARRWDIGRRSVTTMIKEGYITPISKQGSSEELEYLFNLNEIGQFFFKLLNNYEMRRKWPWEVTENLLLGYGLNDIPRWMIMRD